MNEEIRGIFALVVPLTLYGGVMYLFIRWLGQRHQREMEEKRASRPDPLDLDEIIRAIDQDPGCARAEHLRAGRPVYLADPENKGWLIKEFPDGRVQRVIVDARGVEYVLERSK